MNLDTSAINIINLSVLYEATLKLKKGIVHIYVVFQLAQRKQWLIMIYVHIKSGWHMYGWIYEVST